MYCKMEINMGDRDKEKMDRCSKCRKKVSCAFTCTCKNVFCSVCRVPEEHNCTFDYRAQFQEFLRLKNPVVVSDKVEKI